MTPLETLIEENNRKPVELADELNSMRVLGEAFDKIDEDTRERIIFWLHNRYDIKWACEHCECECDDCDDCG